MVISLHSIFCSSIADVCSTNFTLSRSKFILRHLQRFAGNERFRHLERTGSLAPLQSDFSVAARGISVYADFCRDGLN